MTESPFFRLLKASCPLLKDSFKFHRWRIQKYLKWGIPVKISFFPEHKFSHWKLWQLKFTIVNYNKGWERLNSILKPLNWIKLLERDRLKESTFWIMYFISLPQIYTATFHNLPGKYWSKKMILIKGLLKANNSSKAFVDHSSTELFHNIIAHKNKTYRQ